MRISDVRTRIFTRDADVDQEVFSNPLSGWTRARDASTYAFQTYAFQEWLVVEVETADGVVGIGNAALAPRIAERIIDEHLTPGLIGRDLFERERVWQWMYRSVVAFGRRGVGLAAVSAVDIAIWDAQARTLGRPVYDLLGGRIRDRIPVYASQLYPSDDTEALAAEAKRYRDDGFAMVKQRMLCGPADGTAGMQRNVELVRVVREAIGPDVELAVDAFMGWDFDYARRMIRLLEPYDLRWVEEPLLPDDLAGYRRLRTTSPIPIAAGEHEATLGGLFDLVTTGAVDVLQPDVNRMGGLTTGIKICAIAEAAGVPVVPHAGQMHNYHLVASQPACPMAEFFPLNPVPKVGNEMPHLLFAGEPIAIDGHVELGGEAGLGIEVAPRGPVREDVVDRLAM